MPAREISPGSTGMVLGRLQVRFLSRKLSVYRSFPPSSAFERAWAEFDQSQSRRVGELSYTCYWQLSHFFTLYSEKPWYTPSAFVCSQHQKYRKNDLIVDGPRCGRIVCADGLGPMRCQEFNNIFVGFSSGYRGFYYGFNYVQSSGVVPLLNTYCPTIRSLWSSYQNLFVYLRLEWRIFGYFGDIDNHVY